MIELAPTAIISPLADIEDSIKGSIIRIGEYSSVDAFVKIKPAGGCGDLIVGQRTYINSGCVFYLGNGISIGNDVLIAANCTFAPVNHEYREKNKTIRSQGFKPSRGGITIEDDVWIGAGVIILDGAHIKTGAVIGAGSLVSGHVEPYSINTGNPLRLTGHRQDHD